MCEMHTLFLAVKVEKKLLEILHMLHFSLLLRDKLCLNAAQNIKCKSDIGTYAPVFEPPKDSEIAWNCREVED